MMCCIPWRKFLPMAMSTTLILKILLRYVENILIFNNKMFYYELSFFFPHLGHYV